MVLGTTTTAGERRGGIACPRGDDVEGPQMDLWQELVVQGIAVFQDRVVEVHHHVRELGENGAFIIEQTA